MTERLARAATVEELERVGRLLVHLEGNAVLLFRENGKFYAVDNRCPHMGFPLSRGTVKDGILTCHWHHARFDLASGGTFDLFADDVRSFPVQVRDGELWVDLSPRGDPAAHQRDRLRDGLEHEIPLVIAKSVIFLLDSGQDPARAYEVALDHGTRNRRSGWGRGLTMLTCFMNLLPQLAASDRARALYQGAAAVAEETFGAAARFTLRPLPRAATDPRTLTRWFRQFVEVRDVEGAERCIVSALRAGADHREMTDMLFAAVTDHRYIDGGHTADFANKAFEALEIAGWEHAEQVLSSLARGFTNASRSEESNAWRHPVDLVELLQAAFERLPAAMDKGKAGEAKPQDNQGLVQLMLADDPSATLDAMLQALEDGMRPDQLSLLTAYTAALRIARFHTSNEFSDWDTALHTFTFANAIHQAVKRSATPETMRGTLDAAMSIYLDRFLNTPPVKLPEPMRETNDGQDLLAAMPQLLDSQQQVNQAGSLIARYLFGGGEGSAVIAMLGGLLAREDRDFHTIQCQEAAARLYHDLEDPSAKVHVLVAAARYLAAHAPTVRAQEQTFSIAMRLHRGEKIYEEEPG